MILVDTGVLVALTNHRDTHHVACREWFLSTEPGDLVIPSPLVAELCYMVALRGGSTAEAAMLEDLADGLYGTIAEVTVEDLRRMSTLVAQYGDLPLGGADASVVALAERLGIQKVATTDRRHFSVVRPRHAASFTLLP